MRASPDGPERGIHHAIEVRAKLSGVDGRQVAPPLQQRGRRDAAPRNRAEFGDGVAVHGDRERLTPGDPLQDAAAVVSEFTDGDVVHSGSYHA